jgi:hypothetical protein
MSSAFSMVAVAVIASFALAFTGSHLAPRFLVSITPSVSVQLFLQLGHDLAFALVKVVGQGRCERWLPPSQARVAIVAPAIFMREWRACHWRASPGRTNGSVYVGPLGQLFYIFVPARTKTWTKTGFICVSH